MAATFLSKSYYNRETGNIAISEWWMELLPPDCRDNKLVRSSMGSRFNTEVVTSRNALHDKDFEDKKIVKSRSSKPVFGITVPNSVVMMKMNTFF
jgi:hypothetical protein